MQTNDSAALEHAVTNDWINLSQRAVRALTEKMTVLPETGRARDANDLFLVVSESGSDYLVDTREGRCDCPDAHYNLDSDESCKHEQRVYFATGERQIPPWVDTDAVDPCLGRHTGTPDDQPPALPDLTLESETVSVQTDGGMNTDKGAQTSASRKKNNNSQLYTYHREPAQVGGKRYVRCTACGAECIPAKPEQMLHREGCPEDEQ